MAGCPDQFGPLASVRQTVRKFNRSYQFSVNLEDTIEVEGLKKVFSLGTGCCSGSESIYTPSKRRTSQIYGVSVWKFMLMLVRYHHRLKGDKSFVFNQSTDNTNSVPVSISHRIVSLSDFFLCSRSSLLSYFLTNLHPHTFNDSIVNAGNRL